MKGDRESVRECTAEGPGEGYFIQIQSNKMLDLLVKEPPRFNTNRHYERYETEEDAWSHHFPDLGLTRQSNSHQSRRKKNPPLTYYKDANTILYTSQTYNNTLEEDKYDMKKKLLLDTSQRTFNTMLKNSTFGDLDTKLINKLYESCKTCFKFRKTKSKSKVSPPMAQDFNHTVCMDSKIWHGKGTIILYLIDMFARFTIAKILPDKTPKCVLKVFVNDWIKF